MLSYQIRHDAEMYCMVDKLGYELHMTGHYWQLNSCQAWIHEAYVVDKGTGEFIPALVLQSYETLVCIKIGNDYHVTRKYSTTTSKQVTTFKRLY